MAIAQIKNIFGTGQDVAKFVEGDSNPHRVCSVQIIATHEGFGQHAGEHGAENVMLCPTIQTSS